MGLKVRYRSSGLVRYRSRGLLRYRSRGLVYQLHTFDELSDTAFWSVDGTMQK